LKILKVLNLLLLSLFVLEIASCDQPKNNTEVTNSADAIYYNGDIITMEGNSINYVEAVALRDGKIVFAGSKAEAEKNQGDSTEMIDLKGKTLMPGFVEPHVHPSIAALILPNEIIAPYDWVMPAETKKGVIGHDAYIKALGESIQKNAKPDEVYWVWGYHQLWHGELNRDMLNKISSDKDIAFLHRSFHEVF
jgi:predicted amidohydrolase YtcJ